MVNMIRHYIGGLIILATLFTIFGGLYNNFYSYYGITDTYVGTSGSESVADRISNMGIIQSLSTFTEGLFTIANPSGITDIIGGLMASAFGLLGLIFGTFLLPVEILGVISGFYYIPPAVSVLIGVLSLVYITFIYLSSRARSDF